MIVNVLSKIMILFYHFGEKIGIMNLAFSIVLFSLFSVILTAPLIYKQQKNAALSGLMKDELNEIEERYKGVKDKVLLKKREEEKKKLYEKYGAKPSGGCFLIILQVILLMYMYQIIKDATTYLPELSNNDLMFLNINLFKAPGKHFGLPWLIPMLTLIIQLLRVILSDVRKFKANRLKEMELSNIEKEADLSEEELRHKRRVEVNKKFMKTGLRVVDYINPFYVAFIYIVLPEYIGLYMLSNTISRFALQELLLRPSILKYTQEVQIKVSNITDKKIEDIDTIDTENMTV